MKDISPTRKNSKKARRKFEDFEPKDLFYRIATELTNLAIERKTSITISETLAALLQTWNRAYYRYRKFDSKHFQEIDGLLKKTLQHVIKYRSNKATHDREEIKGLFIEYEKVLGPVGASKCLHLLAPNFFPLWNRAIAKKYGTPLNKAGNNADLYLQFLDRVQEQCTRLE